MAEPSVFSKGKSLIDADMDFFEDRIKQYEELLKIEHKENWCNEDMNIKQLCEYFNKKDITIRKTIKEMCHSELEKYKMKLTELYIEAGILMIIFFIKIKSILIIKTNV